MLRQEGNLQTEKREEKGGAHAKSGRGEGGKEITAAITKTQGKGGACACRSVDVVGLFLLLQTLRPPRRCG